MPAREVRPASLELPDATAVVDEVRPQGAVLELACGSGVFTERLAQLGWRFDVRRLGDGFMRGIGTPVAARA